MEMRCQELVGGLRARGHVCGVLTSDFRLKDVPDGEEPLVWRSLSLEADVYHYRPFDHLARHPWRLRHNLNALHAVVAAFEPDLVFVWGMWNLSPALPAEAERLYPGRLAYSFAGYWPIEPDPHEQYWLARDGSWPGRVFRQLIGPMALSRLYRPVTARSLRFEHAITCSRFVLERLEAGGLSIPHARVVFSGIDVQQFRPINEGPMTDRLRVLHVGGFVTHKGADVAIQAVAALVRDGHRNIELTIVGRGHPDYRRQLEAMIAADGLGPWVRLAEGVPRARMPEIYRQHDVLVLPTSTDEPLSRAVMEGMASGLVVVATNTGGTPEMITHGQDGLLFKPSDSSALADHLRLLLVNPTFRQELAKAARRTAETRFQIERMVDETETFLQEVLAGAPQLKRLTSLRFPSDRERTGADG